MKFQNTGDKKKRILQASEGKNTVTYKGHDQECSFRLLNSIARIKKIVKQHLQNAKRILFSA